MARFLASLVRWSLWALLVAAVTVALGLTWFRPATRQPLPFNHQKHEKMACVVCHRGVETRARAGIPDIDTCLNCHVTPPVTAAAEVAAWNRAVETKHIAWQRLTRVPRHVYFSHERHVELGQLDCATCHGDIGTRVAPPPHALKPVSMDGCMDCHQREKVINDCARCHK